MSRLFRAIFLAPCFALPAFAQQYKAGKMIFENPGPYSQAALEAASGLHAGSTFNTAGLQKADQALMDTGLFDDAQGTLNGRVTAVDVIFTLKPTPDTQLLPARFENFAWWTPDELHGAVQQNVPLFNGRVPEAGNLADAIDAALQALLAQKSINAKVAHAVVEPTTNTPIRTMSFAISNLDIHFKTVTVVGGGKPELAAESAKAASALAAHPYNESLMTDVLLNPYRNAGYLAAQVTGVQLTPGGTADHVDVNLMAGVQPGDLYRVTALTFNGTPLFSAADFNQSAKLHPGEVASRFNLLESLHPIDIAYKQQGYLDVVALAVPTLDSAAHTVAYTVNVIPGEQYRLRSVIPRGLNPKQTEYFQANWKLPSGELYNETYVTRFLLDATGPTGAIKGLSATFKAAGDPESHLVDLTISFAGASQHP